MVHCKVAILAVDGFEEAELVEPQRALAAEGAQVDVISQKRGEIQGFRHVGKGKRVKVDRTFDDARVGDYDAVVLPGGVVNGDAIRMVPAAREFVTAAVGAGKPVAAYQKGVVSLIEVLQADESLLRASDARVRVQTESARAAVAAFKALGGGWQSGMSESIGGRTYREFERWHAVDGHAFSMMPWVFEVSADRDRGTADAEALGSPASKSRAGCADRIRCDAWARRQNAIGRISELRHQSKGTASRSITALVSGRTPRHHANASAACSTSMPTPSAIP